MGRQEPEHPPAFSRCPPPTCIKDFPLIIGDRPCTPKSSQKSCPAPTAAQDYSAVPRTVWISPSSMREAADLDLLVGTAQVLQLPIGTPGDDAAAAIHPGIRVPRTGTGRIWLPSAPIGADSPARRRGRPDTVRRPRPAAAAATMDPARTSPPLDRGADRHHVTAGDQGVLIEAHTVASVGPYASIMIRPGAAHRRTSSGGQALAGNHQGHRLEVLGRQHRHRRGGLRQNADRSAISKSWKSWGDTATSSGTTTSRRPDSKAPRSPRRRSRRPANGIASTPDPGGRLSPTRPPTR